MKKSTFNNTILYLATLLVSSILFGCNKSNPETISIKPNIEEIINDVDFKIYLNQVDSLKHHLSGRDNKSIMSQTEFIKIYIKAIKENDVEAQKLISNQMGYDENQFWESRLIRINLIQKLNSRYDLSKIELNHFQIPPRLLMSLHSHRLQTQFHQSEKLYLYLNLVARSKYLCAMIHLGYLSDVGGLQD